MFGLVAALVLALLPSQARADIDGWIEEHDEFTFWARSTTDPPLRVELISHGGIPRIEAYEPVPERPELRRLVYYAGTAGTSFMVSFRRIAIVDPRAGRVLGDAIIRLEPQDGSDWDQPRWEWYDRFLIVHEPDFGERFIQLEGPWFEDHAVEIEQVPSPTPLPHALDAVPRIREAIADAVRRRINFAGRYRLVTWGCGSGCTAGGILDMQSGAFHELPFAAHRPLQQDFAPLQVRADSRLLVVSGNLNEERDGTFYFVWDGNGLTEIR